MMTACPAALVLATALHLPVSSLPAAHDPASQPSDPLPEPSIIAQCLSSDGEIVNPYFPDLQLPRSPMLQLEGNFYGVGGRRSSLQQCLFRDKNSPAFGWNWTRGSTNMSCAGQCMAPFKCMYDFSFAGVGYGVDPMGHDSGASDMPVDTSALKSFVVTHNVSWEWTDEAPPLFEDVRRTRFIYDMFLARDKPDGTPMQGAITDEIIISLSGNSLFWNSSMSYNNTGAQCDGCFNVAPQTPVLKNAVWDGYHNYDYWATARETVAGGIKCRFNSFRRVGADEARSQPPLHLDLKPFVDAVRRMWPNEQVGPWLGRVNIATELYDHVSGRVSFHSPPTFAPEYAEYAV